MSARRVTRTVEMSARAVAEGMVTLPEGVTYLAVTLFDLLGGEWAEITEHADRSLA